MHHTNGRQKWSGMSSGGLGVGRDGRASRIQGEEEAGRSGHTRVAGQSRARVGWRS